jgi:hypothetical protein
MVLSGVATAGKGGADARGFDIDATVDGNLDTPSLPEPTLTLRDLDNAIRLGRGRPTQVDFCPLNPCSYSVGLPGCDHIRVTTDPSVVEFSSDNLESFSPGGNAFHAFCVDGSEQHADTRGIAWTLRGPAAKFKLSLLLDSAHAK